MSELSEQLTLDTFMDPFVPKHNEGRGVPAAVVEANRKRLAKERLGSTALDYIKGQGFMPSIAEAEQTQP